MRAQKSTGHVGSGKNILEHLWARNTEKTTRKCLRSGCSRHTLNYQIYASHRDHARAIKGHTSVLTYVVELSETNASTFVLLRPCFLATSAVNKADRLYGPKTALKGKPEKAISSQERPYGMKLTRTRLCVSLLCVTLLCRDKAVQSQNKG